MSRLKTFYFFAAVVGLLSLLTTSVTLRAQTTTAVFINEIHYDNDGTDTGEAIEVAGPAGTDLTGWSLVLYNGNGGAEYNTTALSGTIPDLASGFGAVFVSYPSNGIQNGSPDGIALVDAGSNVIQFLSYEGTLTAVDGPAAGLTSSDIGVSEGSSTPVGASMQLTGTGATYEDFTWVADQTSTFGAVNTGQTFAGGPSGPTAPLLNEFVFNHTGSDTEAFIEVLGDANTDYSAYTVLEIEGDGTSAGIIDAVLPVGTTNAGGYWTSAEDAENGTVTLLLVDGFAGSVGDDLDIDDNGTLDATPWTAVIDDVAVTDGDSGDQAYAAAVLAPGYDGISFPVGGASRIPDGTDTDAAADWVRNDFDGAGLPGFIGTPDPGEALNTPGAANEAIALPAPELVINEIDYDQPSTDTAEFVEIKNVGTAAANLDGVVLELVNGNGGSVYNAIALPAVTLAANDYFVVCANATTVANCDLDSSPDTNFIQNGSPDAAALRLDGSLLDAVSYEGDTAAPYTEGSGAGLEDDSGMADMSISRCPDGVDTDQNNVDFVLTVSTPGASNSCDAPPTAVSEILLAEIVVTPTGGEFVEIYNPGSSPVDLSDYYLTDATFAGGSTYYYNIVTGSNAGGGGFADFHARFPVGATIGAEEYQTIAFAGSAAFLTEYGAAPTYELFDDGSNDGEQVMREALPGLVNGQGGLTNGGEVVVLYFWDGQSDLVTDVDYAVWGDKAEAVDKTGVAIDGPDADSDTSTYLPDTSIADQDVIATGAHAFGNSWQRDDLAEGTEIASGSNGVDGEDETSENLSVTWCENGPTPGAASDCDGGVGAVEAKVHEVQGSGPAVAITGLVQVEAIVVGDFQGGDELDGFFIQEEDADADGSVETSEGIFVYCGGCAMDVNVGDAVQVVGVAEEFFDMSQIDVTEPGGAVTVLSNNNTLPALTEVTLPVTAVIDLEKYEGMYVTFPQELVISEFFNFDRFGEIVLTTDRQFQPTAIFDPGTAGSAARADLNARSRITLDDGRSVQNPDPAIHPNGAEFTLANTFRGGDLVTDATGVLNYSFGLYRLQPTAGATYTAVNDRPAVPDVAGNIEVASFNVLNYFTTIDEGASICGPSQTLGCRGADTVEEFERQRAKIIAAIVELDADVVGLIEIENHVDDAAVQDLVAGLNDALGAGTYDYIATGPVGTDAIKVAFIYQPATVSTVGDYAVLDTPEFVNPNTPDDPKNRAALAQTFIDDETGGIFTAVVNHLKSKGSSCGEGDDDPEAGSCNLTRTLAAQELADWLATDPTGSGDEDFLIIGDLNAYDKEDPIDALKDSGYTDLLFDYQGEFAYTYVFNGQLGYLDYGMANAGLAEEVTGTAAWNINADEPDIIDYDTSFKKDAQDALYAPNPFRSSDHDPVLVGLNVCDEIAPTLSVTMTPDTLWPPNHQYVTVSPIIDVADNFDTDVTVTLLSVVSDEPDNGPGDGNTINDIVINDDGTVDVRAERSGRGDGRVYTFTYEAVDDCGNSTIATATVIVPKNQGRGR